MDWVGQMRGRRDGGREEGWSVLSFSSFSSSSIPCLDEGRRREKAKKESQCVEAAIEEQCKAGVPVCLFSCGHRATEGGHVREAQRA